ncbi:aldose 1-epimerase family protein [Anaerobium acetethylicum]|uniref:Galactose mutarotase n=1 Tax=Anaerobium acetethylicum TaxID=1619234 RepID=A0A1D3TS36_9FIRM|nr:aldose 1-epimerase family protein [Anaerobium acetethylicum]SCP96581.1 Galactose mutarotase [Anaerobium acetethylicum]
MLINIQSSTASAAINSFGAELTSFKNSAGKEFIWQADPAFWPKHSPVLFPSIGNVRNGKTMIEGKEYAIPKHGFARDYDFEIEKAGESVAVFSLTSNDNMLKMYPYKFKLTMTYSIEGETLRLTYDIANLDDREMPFQIGAHPGFSCPLNEVEAFGDYALKFEKPETVDSPLYNFETLSIDPDRTVRFLNGSDTLPLDYSIFENDAVIFDGLESKKVQLLNQSTGEGVEVSYDGFEVLGFWTPVNPGAPFLCIEPWNGGAIYSDESDEFRTRRHTQIAAPGATKTYALEIRIL